jgi:hypothetical protein
VGAVAALNSSFHFFITLSPKEKGKRKKRENPLKMEERQTNL